jgi:hypothetical protein
MVQPFSNPQIKATMLSVLFVTAAPFQYLHNAECTTSERLVSPFIDQTVTFLGRDHSHKAVPESRPGPIEIRCSLHSGRQWRLGLRRFRRE